MPVAGGCAGAVAALRSLATSVPRRAAHVSSQTSCPSPTLATPTSPHGSAAHPEAVAPGYPCWPYSSPAWAACPAPATVARRKRCGRGVAASGVYWETPLRHLGFSGARLPGGSCPITVDRRIAPPPAAPERGVNIARHTAPQCPETLSRLPTGRSAPCSRLCASWPCPWKAWRLPERESRCFPLRWSISRWSAWWKTSPQEGQRPPCCWLRVARRGLPVGDCPRR